MAIPDWPVPVRDWSSCRMQMGNRPPGETLTDDQPRAPGSYHSPGVLLPSGPTPVGLRNSPLKSHRAPPRIHFSLFPVSSRIDELMQLGKKGDPSAALECICDGSIPAFPIFANRLYRRSATSWKIWTISSEGSNQYRFRSKRFPYLWARPCLADWRFSLSIWFHLTGDETVL
jgi:hypothetical protein